MAKKSNAKNFIRKKLARLDKDEKALRKKLKLVREKRQRAEERLDALRKVENNLNDQIWHNTNIWLHWDGLRKQIRR